MQFFIEFYFVFTNTVHRHLMVIEFSKSLNSPMA
jgi:hypothetical protein